MPAMKIKEIVKNIKEIDFGRVEDKVVLLRVDLNSSVKDGKLIRSPRIVGHFRTIKKFIDHKAKVVVLAHQGRKGRDDFISLEQHKAVLEQMLGQSIGFCKWDDDYVSKIKSLTPGQALILENTRFLDFETNELSEDEHSKNPLIQRIASVSNFFVLDALSVSHRGHASVVGFIPLLESYAGPLLYEELKALAKLSKIKGKYTLVLGGMKPDDSIAIMEKLLVMGKANKILLGGGLGEMALIAEGIKLGSKEQMLKEKGLLDFLPKLKEIMQKHEKKLLLPVDLAIERHTLREELLIKDLPVNEMTFDIGERTAEIYSREIKKAKSVIANGPVGKFESELFAFGTRKVLEAMASSKGFSLIGGGDTVTALGRLGFKESEFSHVSLAGKALLELISGERLFGLEALAKANKRN
ncbi:MAG: phosphoglycerate kinase [Candidatus Diapherotrites archaeon]|nr:phosphoglycerate kinase [Candidatus Diapherotrites archaeon]